MVQKVPFTQLSGNTMTIGTGTSRVIMGADSGNLKIQDSQSNTSVIEAGAGIVGASVLLSLQIMHNFLLSNDCWFYGIYSKSSLFIYQMVLVGIEFQL